MRPRGEYFYTDTAFRIALHVVDGSWLMTLATIRGLPEVRR